MSRARLPALVAAVVCGGLSIYLALNGSDASLVRDANEHGTAGRYDDAVSTAERVRRAPADRQALLAKARALTAAGRLSAADRAWAEVALRDPNNWQVHFEWARALAILGADPSLALSRYGRARELNPRLPRLGEAGR